MEKRNNLVSVLLIGSLWGIAEATVGYLVHVISLFTFYGLSGMIMSMIAVYFMRMAVKTTGKVSSIFYVSLVAASIKLFDLALPFLPATKTINPAIAILAEGLAVVFAWNVFFKKEQILVASIAAGIGWRIIYGVGIVLFNLLTGSASLLSAPLLTFILSFILLQGLINGLFIYPVFATKKIHSVTGKFATSPVFAAIAFVIAVSFEILSHII